MFIDQDNLNRTVEPRKGNIDTRHCTAKLAAVNDHDNHIVVIGFFFIFIFIFLCRCSGRISMFTSGGENVHFVEKVASGTRYALTIAFTCDSQKSIPDPQRR